MNNSSRFASLTDREICRWYRLIRKRHWFFRSGGRFGFDWITLDLQTHNLGLILRELIREGKKRGL